MHQRHTKNTGLTLAPVLIWLFMQLAMTGVFAAQPSPYEKALNVVVMCTQFGYKTIVLNDDGSLPADAPNASNGCSWCAQVGGVPPTTLPAYWQPFPHRHSTNALWHIVAGSCTSAPNKDDFRIRAPPL